jgi:hypothetical protein
MSRLLANAITWPKLTGHTRPVAASTRRVGRFLGHLADLERECGSGVGQNHAALFL